MDRIKIGVGGGELHETKILVFMEDLSFEKAFYKRTSKRSLLSESVPILCKLKMKGGLIVHAIHVYVTRMI